jgi:hypothetical protein
VEIPITTKHCPKCDRTKSKTEFRRSKVNDDGVDHVCKACWKKYPASARRKNQRERQRKGRLEKLKDIEHKLGPKIFGGGKGVPHTKEVVEIFLRKWGGLEQWIDDVVKDASESKLSPQQKFRYHEMVMRLIAKNVDQGGSDQDLEDLSDDDIMRTLSNHIRDLSMSDGD